MRELLAAIVFAGVAAGLAGCGFSLAPTPDPTVYYVLSPVEYARTDTTQSDLHVGIGPISLPDYTADTKIVRRSGEAAIDYIPFAQWAEPVKEGFSRALMQDLTARLQSPYVVMYPWYANQDVDWAVPVDVTRFEATSNGNAVLTARWRVEDATTRRLMISRESRLEEPIAGTDTQASIGALNRLIDRLADEIAAGISNLGRRKMGTGPIS